MRFEYLLVLLVTVLVPLLRFGDTNLPLKKNLPAVLKTLLAVSFPYWTWDVAATARGHWSFNEHYLLGVSFFGLPLEEILFFPVVVFVSIFVWESVKYFTGTE